MLTFLVLCILVVIAFPLFVWIAVAGFWVIVGLIAIIAFIWAVFWAIEGLEYMTANPPAVVADVDWDIVWTLMSGAGAIIGIVVIVVCVVFTPKIVGKK